MTLKAEKRVRREAERLSPGASPTGKSSWLRLDHSPCPDEERPARFGFACPRGRGMCGGLLIAGADLGGGRVAIDGKEPACWTWNGDRERPTFSPSIHCLESNLKVPAEKYGGCGWHGHIKDGVIT